MPSDSCSSYVHQTSVTAVVRQDNLRQRRGYVTNTKEDREEEGARFTMGSEDEGRKQRHSVANAMSHSKVEKERTHNGYIWLYFKVTSYRSIRNN